MNIKIQKTTAESFKKYGQVVEIKPKTIATVTTDQVTFWKQQASYYIKGKTEIGILKVNKSEMSFSELENHFITPTIIIPIDGDFIMSVAEPSDKTPASKDIKAFHTSKDQLLILAPKSWHGSIYPVNDNITLLIFFEENTLDNDTVYEPLDEKCTLFF